MRSKRLLPATTGALVLLSLLWACAPASTPPTGNTPVATPALAGSQWRLVEFRSMDDAQGTTRPGDPDKYTMNLGVDGRVSFRLDCNRGTGSWSATPSSDGVSGSISFSELGVTRAYCPPPSMGGRLAADAPAMRGYILKDGKLFVSLMADAGIYVWEPVPGM